MRVFLFRWFKASLFLVMLFFAAPSYALDSFFGGHSVFYPKKAEVFSPNDLVHYDVHNVNFFISASYQSFSNFKEWVYNDKPDVAQHNCSNSNCMKALKVLQDLGVRVVANYDKPVNLVSLNYHRTVAVRCKLGNLGCSVNSNLLNSVSDWQVLKEPEMIGHPRADSLLEKYRNNK